MKNPADKRKQINANISKNENTNLRIKAMLSEFANPNSDCYIEDVRPHSPGHIEKFKLYEEFALTNIDDKNEYETKEIVKISASSEPKQSDIKRYKLWLEQKYRSPYTGAIIPLAKLFTTEYEIEHIIPQSRYFDDSLTNKIICEAEVNRLKDRKLAYEFIRDNEGTIVDLGKGRSATIFRLSAYEEFVQRYFKNSKIKKQKLLMDEIPDGFIERQLNDSRYISKYVKSILSNIVREKDSNGEYEEEAVSKNLISCNGAITDRLKKDWGVNNQWNKIILPRFRRLNDMLNTTVYTSITEEGHEIPSMPLEQQKGFNKKRIDHRHHAMDAIVIACTTRSHVHLLNNESALSKNNKVRYALSNKLRRYEDKEIEKYENNIKVKKVVPVAREFFMPWESFPSDIYSTLLNMIVSIKQNQRVINKAKNSTSFINNEGKKDFKKQIKGDCWAIRKPMHKETVFGEVNLRMTKTVKLNKALENPLSIIDKDLKRKIIELQNIGKTESQIKKYFTENSDIWSDINLSQINVYYYTKETNDRYFATRKSLDTSFNRKKIQKITDTGIQKILINYLESKLLSITPEYIDKFTLLQYWQGISTPSANKKEMDDLIKNASEIAFSSDGVSELNLNIRKYNNGKNHKPIIKVREYEEANKFAVGKKGNRDKKFVEAAQNTNLFFAIYQNKNEERVFETIPLNLVIERQKNGLSSAPEENKDGDKLLFTLSPNDLVYVPTEEEVKSKNIYKLSLDRIYKFVSCNKYQAFFIPCNIASQIITQFSKGKEKDEKTTENKKERAWDNTMIKSVCFPIKVDRLGNIEKLF